MAEVGPQAPGFPSGTERHRFDRLNWISQGLTLLAQMRSTDVVTLSYPLASVGDLRGVGPTQLEFRLIAIAAE
jgi:hypothetical protein